MKKSIGRIIVLAAVVALIGALVISAVAFAAGPGSAVQSQNGNVYGGGHNDGPLGGEQFGPGPQCDDDSGTCPCQP